MERSTPRPAMAGELDLWPGSDHRRTLRPRPEHARPVHRLTSVGLAGLLALGAIEAAPASAQPRIREALPCEREGSAGGLARGSALTRVDVDPVLYPEAICNDGTPAVFYVRPALTDENRDSWHIHLQGGGGCLDGQSCAERWCSVDTNFGADKMSTLYAPEGGIVDPGILRDDPRNPIWDWNQVLVYYCSSDSWTGRADDRELEAAGPQGGSIEYRMPFHGADIVDAVLDVLQGGDGPLVLEGEGGASRSVPDLDEARRVLFSGASAGGGGVTYNADRVEALLRETNVRCAGEDCPLDFRALVDSTLFPDTSDLDASQSAPCLESGLCTTEELLRAQWDQVLGSLRAGQETEDSCASWHRDNAPGTEWRCADGAHVLENHVSSPLFVRMDLQDNLLSSNFVERGYLDDGRPVTPTDFGERTEATLRRFADRADLSEEALAAPVVLGAQCTRHESLRNNESYYDHLAPAPDGLPYATPDLLRNWLEGEGPLEAIVPFRQPGRLPSCDREQLSEFVVDVTWTDFEGTVGLGQPVGGSDDSGLFWFFDEDNWEVLVKVLDTCAISDHYWVFAAATTNVAYTLRVTDPRTGATRTYRNPLGGFAAAITDTTAFPCQVEGARQMPAGDDGIELRVRDRPSDPQPDALPAPGGCVDGDTELCLAGSRFEVRVAWRDFQGRTGEGMLVPFRSDDSGLFWFFDEDNWEVLVKVLDACTIADRFWVLAAGTTNLETTLTVTDTLTGEVREYRNELGEPAEAIIDTEAFPTCSP
ncbi:MAG TPA: pectin acetylesterase-family hydrolase [Thermoanaerobaculia bacterium]|nr:pectin acetylesterase-family hydrolase [Thermoanaerobaculia bacterium]